MSSANQAESNPAVASRAAERRRHQRFPFSGTVEAIEIKSKARITGRTTELGMGGCYVETLSPFPVGAEVKMRILKGRESFEAHARVVYTLIGTGMGLAFVSAQPTQVRIFQRWLQEISGSSIPAPETHKAGAASSSQSVETPTLKNVVMSDLIMTLMQKNVLTDGEAMDLLRKLFRKQT